MHGGGVRDALISDVRPDIQCHPTTLNKLNGYTVTVAMRTVSIDIALPSHTTVGVAVVGLTICF